ncbi:hypothetical protein QBC38DRAFT_345548, partial [Podospora fimiseda]
IFRNLEIFVNHSRSAAYLPLVLAVENLNRRERKVRGVLFLIRHIESKTGHGSWGGHEFEIQGDNITQLTADLGSAYNDLSNNIKHLNMVEEIFSHITEIFTKLDVESSTKGRRTKESDKSILAAIQLLKEQATAVREQGTYLETRVRNQSTVLFSFLTHQDSVTNIQIANSSIELADVTRRDGSSMKTVAVLMMGFLPATFVAALFSMQNV